MPEPIPDLLKAVNEASGKAFTLWITFLGVGTYLVIAIGTTTDQQLLVSSTAGTLKLPLLGVDLSLVAFYSFAPPLFVVLHLYVLTQLYLLAHLLRRFDEDLRAANIIEHDRRRVRDQLDKFVLTQYLIGSPDDIIVRWVLGTAVWLSYVGPTLLLLGFELRFLRFHNPIVTLGQQVTLLADLALLLLLWPKIIKTGAQRAQAVKVWRVGFACICVPIGAFSFLVTQQVSLQGLVVRYASLIETDEDKLAKLSVTLFLRGRDLRFADFTGSDFRKTDFITADLTRSDLTAANLDSARLTYARLNDADMTRANLSHADLSGALLTGARLTYARLNDADMTRANLSHADLSGALLTGARLTYARLNDADMTRADLSHANLSGANLSGARLNDARLNDADMIQADLSHANLSGALLTGAQNLTQAQLDAACGEPPQLAAGSGLRWDSGRPCR